MTSVGAERSPESSNGYDGKKLVVCIPAYNEAKNVADVVRKASKYASEVIIYDDGSHDNTAELARISGAEVIKSPKNKGYGAAIAALFEKAKRGNYDIMVTLDSDGQHDPAQIPELLEPIIRGESDIVVGSRFIHLGDKQKVPRYRQFGIRTITKVAGSASYKNITDAQSGFRAYNKRALAEIDLFEVGMEISVEILLRAKEKGLRIKEVPISVNYDLEETSTHNPLLHGARVFLRLVQFISLRHPLLFYGCPGIAFLLIAAYFTNNALEMFSSTRFVSTNLILIAVGLAVVGTIFLATGAIVYTLVALFKGKLKDV